MDKINIIHAFKGEGKSRLFDTDEYNGSIDVEAQEIFNSKGVTKALVDDMFAFIQNPTIEISAVRMKEFCNCYESLRDKVDKDFQSINKILSKNT